MNRFWICMILGAALAACSISAETLASNKKSEAVAPGTDVTLPAAEERAQRQLLVRFEESVTDQQIATINKRLGATVINRMSEGKLLLVEVPYANTVMQVMDAYNATPGVRYAEPNFTVEIQPEATEPPAGTSPSIPEKGGAGGVND